MRISGAGRDVALVLALAWGPEATGAIDQTKWRLSLDGVDNPQVIHSAHEFFFDEMCIKCPGSDSVCVRSPPIFKNGAESVGATYTCVETLAERNAQKASVCKEGVHMCKPVGQICDKCPPLPSPLTQTAVGVCLHKPTSDHRYLYDCLYGEKNKADMLDSKGHKATTCPHGSFSACTMPGLSAEKLSAPLENLAQLPAVPGLAGLQPESATIDAMQGLEPESRTSKEPKWADKKHFCHYCAGADTDGKFAQSVCLIKAESAQNLMGEW